MQICLPEFAEMFIFRNADFEGFAKNAVGVPRLFFVSERDEIWFKAQQLQGFVLSSTCPPPPDHVPPAKK